MILTVKKYSLDKVKIKVLLLEGIHPNAEQYFRSMGYNSIENLNGALEEDELKEKIKSASIIGIRSRTQLNAEVLKVAERLIAIGCYSIGTNQVNGNFAKLSGIPVFNAPFSNTRSVAELVIAEIIMLLREIPSKNSLAHKGKWLKSANNSYEIRGKNLGIVGYGHIGSQVSILAEAMGMSVFYYDIEKKLSLGKAYACSSLEELLAISDVVTLHVPSTPLTKNLIAEAQIKQMKDGACLINLARGSVVDVSALANALKSKKISGAAVDVFPEEPSTNNDPFVNVLQEFDNVILTPHIGGSTIEAQANIGMEVSEKLVNYSDTGSTIGATNFVQISLQANTNKQRFMHIHKNVPGVMRQIDHVFTSKGINIASQYLQTDPEIGYVIIDTDSDTDAEILNELKNIDHTIKARMLY